MGDGETPRGISTPAIICSRSCRLSLEKTYSASSWAAWPSRSRWRWCPEDEVQVDLEKTARQYVDRFSDPFLVLVKEVEGPVEAVQPKLFPLRAVDGSSSTRSPRVWTSGPRGGSGPWRRRPPLGPRRWPCQRQAARTHLGHSVDSGPKIPHEMDQVDARSRPPCNTRFRHPNTKGRTVRVGGPPFPRYEQSVRTMFGANES